MRTLDPGIKLHDATEDLDDSELKVLYRELIGSLIYLAQETRPDIAHAMSALSRWCTSYKKLHWTCAKRVLRYLKGTIDHGLCYTKTGKNLIGFTDANWGSCSLDRIAWIIYRLCFSVSRCIHFLGIVLSSTEAEYTALSKAAKEAIYLSKFLCEVDFM